MLFFRGLPPSVEHLRLYCAHCVGPKSTLPASLSSVLSFFLCWGQKGNLYFFYWLSGSTIQVSSSPVQNTPENLVSRDGFVRQSRPASACSSPYSGGIWCLLAEFLPISAAASIYLFKLPYAIGSVPTLSGHANTYRWRSLPRVRRHRASKPQGSFKWLPPWQVTMDPFICASLSPIVLFLLI